MEKNRIVLTPEELYEMSILMDAEYLDFGYMASMGTMGRKPALLLRETRGELSAKGLVEEDFSGELNIPDNIAGLFRPVFSGKTETQLVIAVTGEDASVSTVRFHFLEGGITCVEGRKLYRIRSG